MKSLKFARLAAIAAVATLSTAAFAGDTATLNVQASVTGTCKLYADSSATAVTAPFSMDFGAIDPLGTADATKSTTVYFKCSKGTSGVTFAVGGTTDGSAGYSDSLTGAGGAAGTTLPFSITWATPTTFNGFGVAPQTITLNGKILKTDYAIANAGTYSKTGVTLAINP
ncbi:hypothetical protein [Ramlibacter algicola]|uniref:Spore coat protein U domain-containing protein n=1 Tax=Ramlibacter algicola TaxID=2795217 RepID=A0A934PZG0_9BURK|nr:hypothetical protein [Ramlibacter algicola]MBK0391656.1 hypothetical protein [Ramlibacter algicola]